MKRVQARLSGICLLVLVAVTGCQRLAPVAGKPLYRDPVYDGAADPVLVWNPQVKRWWMFYTNRRANVPGLSGVSWVHGTPIGIAESADAGASWRYLGTAALELPPEYGGTNLTAWAPDVIRAVDGTWRMFLTVVPGVFNDWGHPRFMVQLTSTNLLHWREPQRLALASDRVIDASVLQLPDGSWRMWYNDERSGKSIHYADSPDLRNWTDKGLAFKSRGEGPKAFRWRGEYWVVIDEWKGLGVYRSEDAVAWSKQPSNLLARPGKGADDQVMGGHPDVVVSGDRAYLFYFTHPGRRGPDAGKDTTEQRRSSIQVVELKESDGWLQCERDEPVRIRLKP